MMLPLLQLLELLHVAMQHIYKVTLEVWKESNLSSYNLNSSDKLMKMIVVTFLSLIE